MNRIHIGPQEPNDNSSSRDQPDKANDPVEAGINDWNTENAAFVAAYNELIDAEGVALEEYRLF